MYTRKYPKVGLMVLIAASMIVVSTSTAAGAEVSAGTLASQTAGGNHCC